MRLGYWDYYTSCGETEVDLVQYRSVWARGIPVTCVQLLLHIESSWSTTSSMVRYPSEVKDRAIKLRRAGKTFSEIRKSMDKQIPKGTLSDWFEESNYQETTLSG